MQNSLKIQEQGAEEKMKNGDSMKKSDGLCSRSF